MAAESGTRRRRQGRLRPGIRLKPTLFGILNVTPDSFSDGGRFVAPEAAIRHAEAMLARGADVIDVGGAASGPRAQPIETHEEIRRISPVLAAFRDRLQLVSVDTSNPAVQRHVLGLGVGYLNDVTGFPEPAVYDELAHARAKLVVMHSMTGAFAARRKTAPGEAVASATRFYHSRIAAITRAGGAPARLVLDPGMGLFLGDDAIASLEVLRGLGDLKRRYGLPVMVAVSRKSFLGEITGAALAKRGPGTLATELYAIQRHGAEYVRTHDPGALHHALRVFESLDSNG